MRKKERFGREISLPKVEMSSLKMQRKCRKEKDKKFCTEYWDSKKSENSSFDCLFTAKKPSNQFGLTAFTAFTGPHLHTGHGMEVEMGRKNTCVWVISIIKGQMPDVQGRAGNRRYLSLTCSAFPPDLPAPRTAPLQRWGGGAWPAEAAGRSCRWRWPGPPGRSYRWRAHTSAGRR